MEERKWNYMLMSGWHEWASRNQTFGYTVGRMLGIDLRCTGQDCCTEHLARKHRSLELER
jgi:hypothetical protein